jgi:hypothetical protein
MGLLTRERHRGALRRNKVKAIHWRLLGPKRLENVLFSGDIQLIEEILLNERIDLPIPDRPQHFSVEPGPHEEGVSNRVVTIEIAMQFLIKLHEAFNQVRGAERIFSKKPTKHASVRL